MVELNVANISTPYSLPMPMEVNIAAARVAGFDGIEAHPTNFSIFQAKLGLLLPNMWKKYIHSIHQGFRGKVQSPQQVVEWVFLPGNKESLKDCEQISRIVSQPLPTVIYPDTALDYKSRNFSERLIQPTKDTLRDYGYDNPLIFRDWMIANKLTACIDIYHIQSLGEQNQNDVVEELAGAGLITEVHVPAGRSDFGRNQGDNILPKVLSLAGVNIRRVVVEGFKFNPTELVETRKKYARILRQNKLRD